MYLGKLRLREGPRRVRVERKRARDTERKEYICGALGMGKSVDAQKLNTLKLTPSLSKGPILHGRNSL